MNESSLHQLRQNYSGRKLIAVISLCWLRRKQITLATGVASLLLKSGGNALFKGNSVKRDTLVKTEVRSQNSTPTSLLASGFFIPP